MILEKKKVKFLWIYNGPIKTFRFGLSLKEKVICDRSFSLDKIKFMRASQGSRPPKAKQ